MHNLETIPNLQNGLVSCILQIYSRSAQPPTRTLRSPKNTAPATEVTVQSCVEQAKRAFALKKYEQAIDHYATALELA